MPAIPFIAVALGASGALAAGGAALASAIGIGTVSTAAATAIGAAAFSGVATAVQGGSASQVLKSAVLGGVTSYAGSAIAGSVANSVANSATGVSSGVAQAMGRVAGSAVAGAITSGTSALLTGKGDPIEALLKGGLTAALSAGVGEGVNAVLKDVPVIGNPMNNSEAAISRATRAAIGTAIVSGGDTDRINAAILNSFASTAGILTGQQIRDSSSKLSSANEQFRASEQAYSSNLESQNSLVNQYNTAIQPLIDGKAQLDGLVAKYDDFAYKYNNYDSYMQKQGYSIDVVGMQPIWDGGAEYVYGYGKLQWVPEHDATGYDENGNVVTYRQPGRNVFYAAPEEESKDYFLQQAKAIDSQATTLANTLTTQSRDLLGGEVTKYRTETHMEYGFITTAAYGDYVDGYWGEYPVETQVAYKEKIEGSLTPIKNQLEQLKGQTESLGQGLITAKTNLEKAVEEFNTTETANAAVVDQQLKNFTTASNQYKAEFGVDPTEEQLTSFANTGDILGAVSKLVADNNNEQFAKESGFNNYADFTAAGNFSPNEFYAKRAGWGDYAEQLKAQGMGFDTPNSYNTHLAQEQEAVNRGFANYADMQAADNTPANDFYAQKSGWGSFAQKQQAEDAGIFNPTAWSNQQTATNSGFPDYATYQQYSGDKNAYATAQNEAAAVSAGFPNYATQQSFGGDIESYKNAQNEIMAKNAYFPDFYTFKQFNGDLELYQHFTRNEDAKSAGFPDYATQMAFGGDRDAYEKSITRPAEAPGLGDVANLITSGGETVAGPGGFTTKMVAAMPQMQPRENETAGDVEEVLNEDGSTTYKRTISRTLANGDVATYDITYDPENQKNPISYDTVSGDATSGFNIRSSATRPDFDAEAGVSTDTSLPGAGEIEGEDGTSDFGDVKVPGDGEDTLDGGVSTDTSLPGGTDDTPDGGVSTDTSLPGSGGPGDTVDGGISTDTSLPGDPVDGEDGTSDFGDVVVPEEGGVSTDTSLPTDEKPTDEEPTDGQEPVEEEDTDTTETEECPEGYVRNLNTGACELVVDTDEPDPCGDGYHWDESRQICVPDSDEEDDEECPPGYARNLSTGECELIEEERPQDCGEGYHWDEDRQLCVPDSDEEEDDECPEGYIRNLNTGECIPITTGGGGKGVVTPPPPPPRPPRTNPNLRNPFLIPEPSIVTSPSISDDPVMKGALPEMPQETKFQGPLDQFLKIATGSSFTPKPPQPQQAQQQAGSMNDRLSYPQGGSDYFSYGQQSDIENNLDAQFGQSPTEPPMEGALQFKQGGMATPLMAGGGTTRYGKYAGGGLNVINHSGKQRLDFRKGAAVSGPGDGQSDDIPAMLADGEFVFPADVVAALGNGSTKAGSDKLYDMMHSIRAYHRSAKPKDLPPPAKKSPLDYLKKAKKARS